MLNRIIEIIDRENLSHASFADEIGVQRSSISHILNRRNKPSLDFAIKTLQRFSKINPEWLILGSGDMYKDDISELEVDTPQTNNSLTQDLFSALVPEGSIKEQTEIIELPLEDPVNEELISKKHNRYVSQILIFYSDSTYGTFKPEKK